MQPNAPLLSDNDLDMEWMAEFEDFGCLNVRNIGMLLAKKFLVPIVFGKVHSSYSTFPIAHSL